MMDDMHQMFSSRVSFNRNDFLSPVQEEIVSFPRRAFSDEDIKRNEVGEILKFHARKRDVRISNDLPNVSFPSSYGVESDNNVRESSLRKRKFNEAMDTNTPEVSADEPPMKKIKLEDSSESGREIKRRAQRIIETDPKKGCYLYMKAGIQFLEDAAKLEEVGKTMQSCSYYRDNFTYFSRIIYFFKKYKCEKYISLSCIGAALSGIKNFMLQLQSLNSEGRLLYHAFNKLKTNLDSKGEGGGNNNNNNNSSNSVGVDQKMRNRTMTYITDTNNMVRVFQSLEEADRRLPKKHQRNNPLHKEFTKVNSVEVINYLKNLLEEFAKLP